MSNKKIDKLTKAQEAKIPEYIEKYFQVGLSTTPCDRVKAEEAIARSYAYQKLAPPIFEWVDSPKQGCKRAAQLLKGSLDVTAEEIRDQASKASYGSFEAYWVAFYDFIASELPIKSDELIGIVKDIVQNSGVYWTFEGMVVISEKPTAIHLKDKKLHNPNGLALEYKDGSGIVAINGQRFPSLLEMYISAKAGNNEEAD